jgi:hypothetical protein
MKKSLFVFFILFLISLTISNAQSLFQFDSLRHHQDVFYIVYNNWNDSVGQTNFIGIGTRAELQNRPIFQEFELLIPFGKKSVETVGIINLDAGVNIFGGNALFLNDLKTSINAGFGIKGILTNITKSLSDDLKIKLHFFAGVDWKFSGYNINLKYGYIFLNNHHNINYWNVNMGYFFDFAKSR